MGVRESGARSGQEGSEDLVAQQPPVRRQPDAVRHPFEQPVADEGGDGFLERCIKAYAEACAEANVRHALFKQPQTDHQRFAHRQPGVGFFVPGFGSATRVDAPDVGRHGPDVPPPAAGCRRVAIVIVAVCAGAEAEVRLVAPVDQVVAATRVPAAPSLRSHNGQTHLRPACRRRTGISRRRGRRRALRSGRGAPVGQRCAVLHREAVEREVLRAQGQRACQGARPRFRAFWPGRPKMKSRLMLSKPAARARVEGGLGLGAPWMRPSQRNSSSSKLCTPMLSRLTPSRAQGREARLIHRAGIGLAGDLGVRCHGEGVAGRRRERAPAAPASARSACRRR